MHDYSQIGCEVSICNLWSNIIIRKMSITTNNDYGRYQSNSGGNSGLVLVIHATIIC